MKVSLVMMESVTLVKKTAFAIELDLDHPIELSVKSRVFFQISDSRMFILCSRIGLKSKTNVKISCVEQAPGVSNVHQGT